MLRLEHIKLIIFVALMSIYAGFSTPFPREVGFVEVLVGVLLVLLVGAKRMVQILTPRGIAGDVFFREHRASIFFFYYMLFVPLVMSFALGWSLNDFIRDFIPFLYLCIPILVGSIMVKSRLDWGFWIKWLLVVVGTLISLRFFQDSGGSLQDVGREFLFDGSYLSYDPAVTFTALFICLNVFDGMALNKQSLIKWLLLPLGLLAFASLAAISQRAPLGMSAVFIVIYVVYKYRRSPLALGLAVTGMIGFIILNTEQLLAVYDQLYTKQKDVGENGKLGEWPVIADQLASSWHGLLFGDGWGALFHAPSTNGALESYTHSAFSYFFLKSGLVGMMLFSLYLFYFFKSIMRNAFTSPVFFAALVAIIGGVFFQPTFKVLTFGFIMLLVFLEDHRLRKQELVNG